MHEPLLDAALPSHLLFTTILFVTTQRADEIAKLEPKVIRILWGSGASVVGSGEC